MADSESVHAAKGEERIRMMFQLAYQREPKAWELNSAKAFIDQFEPAAEAWERFVGFLPEEERNDVLNASRERVRRARAVCVDLPEDNELEDCIGRVPKCR